MVAAVTYCGNSSVTIPDCPNYYLAMKNDHISEFAVCEYLSKIYSVFRTSRKFSKAARAGSFAFV
jgi:hypothetical protein